MQQYRGQYQWCLHEAIYQNPEGKERVDFFNLPPNSLSNWVELYYQFKYSYGQQISLVYRIKEYNSMMFHHGETIKDINLRFIKLYNKILDVIRPRSQDILIHYYSTIPLVYKTGLKKSLLIAFPQLFKLVWSTNVRS